MERDQWTRAAENGGIAGNVASRKFIEAKGIGPRETGRSGTEELERRGLEGTVGGSFFGNIDTEGGGGRAPLERRKGRGRERLTLFYRRTTILRAVEERRE